MENEDIAKRTADSFVSMAHGIGEKDKELKDHIKNGSLSAGKDALKKARKKAVGKAIDAKTAAADKADRAATKAAKSATHAAGAVVPGGAAVSKAADKTQDAAYKTRSAARQETGEMEKRAAGAADGKRFSLDDKIKSMAKGKGMAIVTGKDAVRGIKSVTDLMR